MYRIAIAVLISLVLAPAALARSTRLQQRELPAAAARHADEIAAKQARFERALALGVATPRLAPIPEPSRSTSPTTTSTLPRRREQLLSGTATIDVTA